MTMLGVPIRVASSSTSAPGHVLISVGASNIAPEHSDQSVPLTVAADQLYYWTAKWQREEREALSEIERGETRVFDTSRDAIRWLLDSEDD